MKTTMKITAYISMYSETRFSYDDQGYDFSETLATDEIVRKDFIKTLGYLTIDEKEQTIWYQTNSDPSDKVVAAIAKKFPDARIEYGYEKADDDEHDMFDVYNNGILVSHEDKIVTWNEEDEDEEDE